MQMWTSAAPTLPSVGRVKGEASKVLRTLSGTEKVLGNGSHNAILSLLLVLSYSTTTQVNDGLL